MDEQKTPKKRVSKKKVILIILLVVILLGGAGVAAYYTFFSRIGDDESSYSQNANATPTQNLAAAVGEIEELSKFSQLVTAAGVNVTLQTVGTEYLVLAPDNYVGYDSLPSGYYDSLLLPDKQTIALNIAQYHVALLPGADLVDGQKLMTLNGQEVIVGLTDGEYSFTDAKGNEASVIGTVNATNGTIYVIDSILLPQ